MSFSSDQPLLSNQLPISIEIPRGKESIETIELLFKRMVNAVNTKEGALYLPQELATFQQYFTPDNPQKMRNVYRRVVDFGALPNTGTKTVPHGIVFDSNFTLTRLYAAATDPTNLLYISLPYVSVPPSTESIEIYLDSDDVVIITESDYSEFTRCTVVIEFMKNL